MDYKQIESKWQKIWADTGLYKFDRSRVDKKYYCLEMFSYPSGAKLHAGHWYNYGPADTFARFKRMQGYEVGRGYHHRLTASKSISVLMRQLSTEWTQSSLRAASASIATSCADLLWKIWNISASISISRQTRSTKTA